MRERRDRSSSHRVAGRAMARYNARMKGTRTLTAIIRREDEGFVALCPELDVASQGATVEEARANLIEALGLFLESADQSEIDRRLSSEVFISPVEVAVG
jgi:predicted RNase H-like HicB family nuclease